MKSILKYMSNIWFKQRANKQRRKLILHDQNINNKQANFQYKKRKNIHFQTSLDGLWNTKLLLYSSVSIGLILILGSLWLFFGSTFRVQTIEVIRKDNLSNINLVYNSLDNIRGKSLFHIDKKQIIESIYSYQNNIQNVSIESSLPDTLIIHVGSSKALFNTRIQNKDYIITQNGSFVPNNINPDLKNMSIVFRDTPTGIVDYKKILAADDIEKISYTIQEIEKNIIGFEIENIFYLPKEREYHMLTPGQTLLIFDLGEDINLQIKKLAIFDKEYSPIIQDIYHYIDFRVPEKIHSCEKQYQKICEQTLRDIYGSTQQQ